MTSSSDSVSSEMRDGFRLGTGRGLGAVLALGFRLVCFVCLLLLFRTDRVSCSLAELDSSSDDPAPRVPTGAAALL